MPESEVTTTVFMPRTPLSCGHTAPEPAPGIANGVAINTVTNETMCYPCADELHRWELFGLRPGQNHHAYVRLNQPHGYSQLPAGVVGEITSWSGGRLGLIVPGTLRIVRGRGFGGVPTSRIHFRAVVQGFLPKDFHKTALFYGTGSGDGMLVTLKRMVDRPDPAGDAPHPTTKAGRRVRGL